MMQLPLALQAAPEVTLGAFLPVFVALGFWIGFVVYGLWVMRNHPKGLGPLFFTEMWERFSYYGMRALLMYYMTKPFAIGALSLTEGYAGIIYAIYTLAVYALSIPGGWIADRYLGYRKAVLIGGVFIALGEFGLAAGPMPLFYAGLAAISIGTGLLKTNCTSMVGMLYEEGDPRQDGGYNIYYMGINIGALIAPIILGFMAQDPVFVAALDKIGIHSANGWHWAFGFAGLAMVAGLVQYSLRQKALGEVGVQPGAAIKAGGQAVKHEPLTADEKSRMWVVAILVLFIMTFFFIFEQAGTTLSLFADQHTRMTFLGFPIQSSWLQSVNSIWLLLLAPVISWIWLKMGSKEPSSPTKFTLGIFLAGLGMLILVPPSLAYTANPGLLVSPWWLIGTYLIHTIGELCLSPVGLSTVSKLAPARFSGLLMGVFFFAIGMGNFFAGVAASIRGKFSAAALFGGLFGITTIMAIILIALTPRIRRMMAGVH